MGIFEQIELRRAMRSSPSEYAVSVIHEANLEAGHDVPIDKVEMALSKMRPRARESILKNAERAKKFVTTYFGGG